MKQIGGKLTRETYSAIVHTSNALLEMSDYCINELGAKYVLLGKFQTDSLEARFGQYRQLARGKYDVSLRQLYECETKIRLLSVLKLSIQGHDVAINDFTFEWKPYENTSVAIQPHPIDISAEEMEGKQKLPLLAYIAGYCCNSNNKKLKCADCEEEIVSSSGNVDDFQITMIKGLSRGGLLYPTQDVIGIVLVCYVTIKKLSESYILYIFFTTQACC